MIKYALVCDQAHTFESWFPSGDAFEDQRKRGLVACPMCRSTRVEKAIMAPAVARRDRTPLPEIRVPESETQKPVALISEKERELRTMIRALHEHVTKTTEDVGERFAEEARRIHEGEAEERSIRGQASLEEARALMEDGISILPIPSLPDERN